MPTTGNPAVDALWDPSVDGLPSGTLGTDDDRALAALYSSDGSDLGGTGDAAALAALEGGDPAAAPPSPEDQAAVDALFDPSSDNLPETPPMNQSPSDIAATPC
jgi:hypothetical protein